MRPIFRRPDGVPAGDVADFRQFMPALMPVRNQSVVLFDQQVDLSRTLPFLERFNAAHPDYPATPFHLVLWAGVRLEPQRRRINRFVSGGRIYQRTETTVSFAVKRSFDDDAPLIMVKRRFEPAGSFLDAVQIIEDAASRARSKGEAATDRELAILLKLPPTLRRLAIRFAMAADSLNLLPRSFIDNDPFFATAMVANLGSVGLDAAYHHLWEYGTVSVFTTVGYIHDVPLAVDGQVVVRPVVNLRFTYDQRVEDGFYAARTVQKLVAILEDPDAHGAGEGWRKAPPAVERGEALRS